MEFPNCNNSHSRYCIFKMITYRCIRCASGTSLVYGHSDTQTEDGIMLPRRSEGRASFFHITTVNPLCHDRLTVALWKNRVILNFFWVAYNIIMLFVKISPIIVWYNNHLLSNNTFQHKNIWYVADCRLISIRRCMIQCKQWFTYRLLIDFSMRWT